MKLLPSLSLYDVRGNLLWPVDDWWCFRATVEKRSTKDMDRAVKRCSGRSVAVQAGGNCGVWARRLAGQFGTVYTFEPDPVNFVALAVNTADVQNVVRFQAALGYERGMVGLTGTSTNNCGALHVAPEDPSAPGAIPVMRIDDLGLPACDFLALDVEGYEYAALRGAEETIAKYGPVVILEDKGLSDRYGVNQGTAPNMLIDRFGYKVVKRVHRDVILTRGN